MGKYIEQLKERESLLNETSENYILEDNLKKSSSQMYGSTHSQKVQKGRNSVDIPTLTNPQKVQKPTSGTLPTAPLRLLDELESRGLRPIAEGGVILFTRGQLPEKLRAPVVHHRAALLALLLFRQHAETRRRFEHWVCPDRELLDLWKAAEIACACRLTIAGAWSKTNPKREKKIADDDEERS